MLIFVCAIFILLITSLPWVAISRPPNKPAWLLAFYLIASANVVLTSCIANSFYVLNQRWGMLLIHLLLGTPGWLLWKRADKPTLALPFQGWKIKFDVQWLRREPILTLLTLSIAIAYLFALAQIIMIPQNNVDSLSTHLSRIGFWLQHGSLFPWDTFMRNQIWYPINAQLQTYWTLLFLGNDRLVGIVQWLAALISGLGVFGMARLLGYRQRQSAFAALIFLSFPLLALQATTAQTDLVTAVFFLPAVYFLIQGVREERYSLLSLSAMSVGLGLGVKKSYFVLLPVLAVIALLVAMQFGKRSLKPLLMWSLNLIIGIVLFGAYMYVVNWHYWGNAFGSTTLVDTLLDVPPSQEQPIKVQPSPIRLPPSNFRLLPHWLNNDMVLEVVYNTPRLLYQALDTSGLPDPFDGYVHKIKLRLARALFHSIGFDEIEGTAYTAPGHIFSFAKKNNNEESNAWYGPLSVLLLFSALFRATWFGSRKRDYLMLIPVAAFLIFLPVEIIFRPGWDPYQGRYFAPVIALGAPLMAMWFREKGHAFHEWLVSGLAIIIITTTLLYNPSKPTLGRFADEFHVWNNNRVFVQTIERKNNREVYSMVEKYVPAEATLGYYIPVFFMDYPFFGEHLTRRLVPIISPAQVSDSQWLRAQGIEFLLLPRGSAYPTPPPEYQMVHHLANWNLYANLTTP